MLLHDLMDSQSHKRSFRFVASRTSHAIGGANFQWTQFHSAHQKLALLSGPLNFTLAGRFIWMGSRFFRRGTRGFGTTLGICHVVRWSRCFLRILGFLGRARWPGVLLGLACLSGGAGSVFARRANWYTINTIYQYTPLKQR